MLPAPLPAGEDGFTQEQVQKMLPDGLSAKILKDYFNGGFIVWWRLSGPPKGPWRSKSRSWGCRSVRDCVVELLRIIWTVALAVLGGECPIAGLFDVDADVEI